MSINNVEQFIAAVVNIRTEAEDLLQVIDDVEITNVDEARDICAATALSSDEIEAIMEQISEKAINYECWPWYTIVNNAIMTRISLINIDDFTTIPCRFPKIILEAPNRQVVLQFQSIHRDLEETSLIKVTIAWHTKEQGYLTTNFTGLNEKQIAEAVELILLGVF